MIKRELTKKKFKNTMKNTIAAALIILMSVSIYGCSKTSSQTSTGKTSSSGQGKATESSLIDTSNLFSKSDLKQVIDETDSKKITAESGKDVTISKAGTYVVSGTAENFQITVDVKEDEKVIIVLNNLKVTNSNKPVIYVKTADKVFINLKKGTDNTLKVSGDFKSDDENKTDGVIFSKGDIAFNGEGTLNISSSANGIVSKDELKFTGGVYTLNSSEDAIEGKDDVLIKDGSFVITSGKDGIHSENSDDESKGYIYIGGGKLKINASDDGIQGNNGIQIDGGEINIEKSAEGIESTFVQINSGSISVNASDDGINASQKVKSREVNVEINGGTIAIKMGAGDTDAIDSNGNLIINGGTLNIEANSPFDYDGKGELKGGSVTVNGNKVTELTNQQFGGNRQGGTEKNGNLNVGPDREGARNSDAERSGISQGAMTDKRNSPQGAEPPFRSENDKGNTNSSSSGSNNDGTSGATSKSS